MQLGQSSAGQGRRETSNSDLCLYHDDQCLFRQALPQSKIIHAPRSTSFSLDGIHMSSKHDGCIDVLIHRGMSDAG